MKISFIGCDFGDNSPVSFAGYKFPNGSVIFSGNTFSGPVSFSEAKFGDTDVLFNDCKFGDDGLDFINVRFGQGNVHFSKSAFGKGEVIFNSVRFGSGDVIFSDIQFGGGNVSFVHVDFGDGDVFFNKINFANSDVRFSTSVFRGNIVSLTNITAGEGRYSFNSSTFRSRLFIGEWKEADKIKKLDFQSAYFELPPVIKIGDIGCVPDFRETTFPGHFSAEKIAYTVRHTRLFRFFCKANDEEDAERLCRLKKLATQNQERKRALKLNADELRARRWFNSIKKTDKKPMITKWWNGLLTLPRSLLDIFNSLLSDYGQSIFRPLLCLAILIAAPHYGVFWWGEYGCTTGELIRHALPLLNLEGNSLGGVSNDSCMPPIHLLIPYKLSALLFTFLIGLGLRNRFRI